MNTRVMGEVYGFISSAPIGLKAAYNYENGEIVHEVVNKGRVTVDFPGLYSDDNTVRVRVSRPGFSLVYVQPDGSVEESLEKAKGWWIPHRGDVGVYVSKEIALHVLCGRLYLLNQQGQTPKCFGCELQMVCIASVAEGGMLPPRRYTFKGTDYADALAWAQTFGTFKRGRYK